MAARNLPSIDYVRQCVREDNGRLFWMSRPREHFCSGRSWNTWNSRFAGREAGGISTSHARNRNPRWIVCLGYRRVFRSLVVWLLHRGEWPNGLVDHENRIPLDDRIDNLRLASRAQNGANSRRSRTNKSGYKGVSWHKRSGKWQASIRVGGKSIGLGLFDDRQGAHEAYVNAARGHYGEYAHDGT